MAVFQHLVLSHSHLLKLFLLELAFSSQYVNFGHSMLRIWVTFNYQAVEDVATSQNRLIDLFERIHIFLQRLNSYMDIPLTHGFTELLGKIMAQTLSILALSTRAMTERPISRFTGSRSPRLC
jgi:hypothetical protein